MDYTVKAEVKGGSILQAKEIATLTLGIEAMPRREHRARRRGPLRDLVQISAN